MLGNLTSNIESFSQSSIGKFVIGYLGTSAIIKIGISLFAAKTVNKVVSIFDKTSKYFLVAGLIGLIYSSAAKPIKKYCDNNIKDYKCEAFEILNIIVITNCVLVAIGLTSKIFYDLLLKQEKPPSLKERMVNKWTCLIQ
jgi:hypothetical protein